MKTQKPFSETYLGKLRQQVGSRYLMAPSVRVVIENAEGEILLQHRRNDGFWGLPGGALDEEESIEECLIREVFEETGLTPIEYRVYGYASDPSIEIHTYPNGDVIHSFPLLFHVTRCTGKLDQSNEETLELKFFSPEKLPEMLRNERISLKKFLIYKQTGLFQLD